MKSKELASEVYTAATYDSDLQVAEGRQVLHTIEITTTVPNSMVGIYYVTALWSATSSDTLLLNASVDGVYVDATSKWGCSIYASSSSALKQVTFIGYIRVAAVGAHTLNITWEATTNTKAGENCWGSNCGSGPINPRAHLQVNEYI